MSNYRVKVATFAVARESGAPSIGRALLSSPEEVARVARTLLPDDAREHFGAFYLNTQNRLVAYHEVSTGILNATLVTPRDVLGPALRLMGVNAVVVVHNHPSGDPTPSKEDLALTRQLADGATLLGLQLHDHVILGDGTTNHVSLSQRGAI